MQQNYPHPILERTLHYEGGFSNNPHDPGGATMEGVTQRVYDAYRIVHKLPRAPVSQIPNDELDDIYQKQYWNPIRGDILPSGLDASVFDTSVNSGPTEAIILLQKALGVTADGHIGLMTLAKLRGVNDIEGLISRYNALRLGFMHRLRTWRFFDKGWTARVHDMNTFSIQLARI